MNKRLREEKWENEGILGVGCEYVGQKKRKKKRE